MDKEEHKELMDSKLLQIDGVRSKKMFGGVGYFMDDLMFGGIMYDVFRLKADEVNKPDFEEKGMGPWEVPGKSMKMPYYEVPQEIINDQQLLREWVYKAIEAADRTKKPKPKKRK